MDLCNAFSINMLAGDCDLKFTKVTADAAAKLAVGGVTSHVGHADIANVMSGILGVPVPTVRDTFTMGEEDVLVGQYRGPRLEEGTTSLPEGAVIEWWLVSTK